MLPESISNAVDIKERNIFDLQLRIVLKEAKKESLNCIVRSNL
jgi:hypothetical protein